MASGGVLTGTPPELNSSGPLRGRFRRPLWPLEGRRWSEASEGRGETVGPDLSPGGGPDTAPPDFNRSGWLRGRLESHFRPIDEYASSEGPEPHGDVVQPHFSLGRGDEETSSLKAGVPASRVSLLIPGGALGSSRGGETTTSGFWTCISFNSLDM